MRGAPPRPRSARSERVPGAARAPPRGGACCSISRRSLRQQAEELALLEARNTGKAIADARWEVGSGAACFEYYAGAATQLAGSTPPVDAPGVSITLRQPIGPCALIVPWNFPFLIACWKIAPALAAGNTAVVKPASATPLSVLRLAELAAQAGLPPGVLGVLTGPGESVGAALASDPEIRKISFTGDSANGAEILRLAAADIKRTSLELGGKSASVVFADADLARCVEKSLLAVFGNAGQDCCARSRILVEASVHDAFVEAFAAATRALVVGDPLDPRTQIGSLISRAHRERVQRYLEIGTRRGRPPRLRRRRSRGTPRSRRRLPAPGGVRPRDALDADRARGDLRAGGLDPAVPGRGRGDPARERLHLRPLGLALDPRPEARAARGARDRDGRALGELEPQRLPGVALRRRQAQRARPRARHGARSRPTPS